MSLIVLDASAAVEMFLGTPEGRRLSAKVPKGSTTHVPEHFYIEVAATLRRMELGGAITFDPTYVKAHEGAKVVSKAIVIATGVARTGDREVLGLAVGDSEDGAFWTAFLRSLRARGLAGVKLVISDAHEGLKAAIVGVFVGSAWQRCRVHFMRRMSWLECPKARPRWSPPRSERSSLNDAAAVAEQLETIADKLGRQFPAVASMLRDAAPDILAFATFPQSHWRKIWSTNPLERVNVEIKRRADVVGIFANENSVLRLSGAVLMAPLATTACSSCGDLQGKEDADGASFLPGAAASSWSTPKRRPARRTSTSLKRFLAQARSFPFLIHNSPLRPVSTKYMPPSPLL